ncbi:unnamed protein product [Polarella glacialis]|uniref:Uncharacterized protein n=1 Tax=Polarella glacialis TaxID=89957 RepID=A0A813E0A8_POLGL|nr:unnamed protein product [Polarella glacialis]
MESLWSAAFSFTTAGLLVLGSLVVLVLNALFWCLVLFAQRATHSFEPGVQSTPVRQTVGKFTHAELAELAELAFPEGGLLDELPCAICLKILLASSAAAMRSMPAASAPGGGAACREAGPKSVAQAAEVMLKSASVQL